MNPSKPITEQSSKYDHLEKMSTLELLENINREDQRVPFVLEKAIPAIEKFVELTTNKMKQGGRLFYLGAGTSGRLGVLDASECPPTFGVSPDRIIGLIAGGDKALRSAVENAEDNYNQAWKDLKKFEVNEKDVVLGIAASGTTPYVIGGIKTARQQGIITGGISCNPQSPLSLESDYPIELVVGPELITGSTRMKAGTAQKLALNMISTTIMIKLGKVQGNKMVNMQLSNKKLTQRGTRMLMDELSIDEESAKELIAKHKSVKHVLDIYRDRCKTHKKT